uniref:6-phosphogluconate dehydrogenase C-terminal domain-containing protein n=1 Tax=Desulfatirhabdium butyrativorans TaxID=340467 RepID=A0A7C4VRL9_9BACT
MLNAQKKRLPANLLQVQRDDFGAHAYERIDKPRCMFCHTDWADHGGTVFLVFWNRICFMDVVKMDALEAGYGPPCQENPYLPPFCKAVEV